MTNWKLQRNVWPSQGLNLSVWVAMVSIFLNRMVLVCLNTDLRPYIYIHTNKTYTYIYIHLYLQIFIVYILNDSNCFRVNLWAPHFARCQASCAESCVDYSCPRPARRGRSSASPFNPTFILYLYQVYIYICKNSTFGIKSHNHVQCLYLWEDFGLVVRWFSKDTAHT